MLLLIFFISIEEIKFERTILLISGQGLLHTALQPSYGNQVKQMELM